MNEYKYKYMDMLKIIATYILKDVVKCAFLFERLHC